MALVNKNSLAESVSKLGHHAYLAIGGRSNVEILVSIFQKKLKLKTEGNPDFVVKHFMNMTIDDSRELKIEAEMMSISEDTYRILIISLDDITIEAQNALLKLLEEPKKRVHFFFVVPSLHILLPTVKSRMLTIDMDNETVDISKDSTDISITVEKFVKAKSAQRLEMIKDMMDLVSKEKKTKRDLIDFIDQVEMILHKDGLKKNLYMLEKIALIKKYMNDRGTSMKMLLEYVAL